MTRLKRQQSIIYKDLQVLLEKYEIIFSISHVHLHAFEKFKCSKVRLFKDLAENYAIKDEVNKCEEGPNPISVKQEKLWLQISSA